MIAVSAKRILAGLAQTKGKSGTQLEIERELKALIEKRSIASLTEAELEALFEEAAMECAIKDVAAKMRKDGKIPDLAPTIN